MSMRTTEKTTTDVFFIVNLLTTPLGLKTYRYLSRAKTSVSQIDEVWKICGAVSWRNSKRKQVRGVQVIENNALDE